MDNYTGANYFDGGSIKKIQVRITQVHGCRILKLKETVSIVWRCSSFYHFWWLQQTSSV